jgi:uncharacterized protein YcbK (DUF882 family)
MSDIDWTDPKAQITDHFTIADAIMLHSWNRLANESDGLDDDMKNQLIASCQKWEAVREVLGSPMRVHCMFRSPAYNAVIKAPANDAHSRGQAIDFDCGGALSTDEVKAKMMPLLESMGLRMENNGAGASWVHLDVSPVIHNRFFLP